MTAVRMMIPARQEKAGSRKFSVVIDGTGEEVGPSGRMMWPGNAIATASAVPTTMSATPATVHHTFTLTTLVSRGGDGLVTRPGPVADLTMALSRTRYPRPAQLAVDATGFDLLPHTP